MKIKEEKGGTVPHLGQWRFQESWIALQRSIFNWPLYPTLLNCTLELHCQFMHIVQIPTLHCSALCTTAKYKLCTTLIYVISNTPKYALCCTKPKYALFLVHLKKYHALRLKYTVHCELHLNMHHALHLNIPCALCTTPYCALLINISLTTAAK